MKTLSETIECNKEYLHSKYIEDNDFVNNLETLLIPLNPKFNESCRTSMREGLRTGNMKRIGIACDHCNTELVMSSNGVVLMSNPPKYPVGCPGCGWYGNTTL